MERQSNATAESFLDDYLKELSVKLSHSEFAQLSVGEVLDRLLDLRNLISNN
jgi:hypothetical protein